MTIVNRSRDCGNSPKNTFAQELVIAIERGDTTLLQDALVESATITLRTGEEMPRNEFLEFLDNASKPTTITVDRVVTHGRAGAVDGVSHLGRGRERRFCHVLHFANAKGDRVARIRSYGQQG